MVWITLLQVRASRLPRELSHVLEEEESVLHVAEDAERQRLSRRTERPTISRQVACARGSVTMGDGADC